MLEYLMAANILVFGGSITFGDYDKEGGWVNKLGSYFLVKTPRGKNRPTRVFNLSISGETCGGVLKRLAMETRARHRKQHKLIYIFHIGLNDSILINRRAKIPSKVFGKSVIEIIKVCKKFTDKIIFLSPPPVDEKKVTPMPWSPNKYYYLDRILQYGKTIEQICKKYEADYIDLFKLLPIKKYIALLTDGVHPNSKGHEMIFEVVKNYLTEKNYMT